MQEWEEKEWKDQIDTLKERIRGSEKILVGVGGEWKAQSHTRVIRAYEVLQKIIKDQDYFIVTTVTDGMIWESPLEESRIVAPCGNVHWRQCANACTKDIWEEGELSDERCPHCGKPLAANTIAAETYIEEGYLPKWQSYTRWLADTVNKKLLVLELGEGFTVPTVIRWPFEKTVFFNKKSHMYRINEEFYHTSEEIREKAAAVAVNSVDFILGFERLNIAE